MRPRFRLFGALVAAASLLVASGAMSVAPTMAARHHGPRGTLEIGISAFPPDLDPNGSTALYDRYVQYQIFDRLYDLNKSGKIVPDLATALPKITDGGKVYTFSIHRGIKFTDGTTLNAKAVVYNLERYMQSSSARHGEVSSISTVSATGPYTVKITLSQPYAPLVSMLVDRSGMIGSPKAIKAEGSDFQNDPVGSGPFEYVSSVKGSTITLKANPHYWKGEPKVEKVVFRTITDPNIEVANLQSGQVQIIDTVPSQDYSTLKQRPTRVTSTSGLQFQGFFLNTTEAPFNNVWNRRAVSAAIDRTALVKVVFPGIAETADSPFSPGSEGGSAAGPVAKVNDAQATRDLALAGNPDGFSFTFTTTAGNSVAEQVAEVLQSQLAKVGIKMSIAQEQFGSLLTACSKQQYEACALGWSGRVDPDGNIYNFFHTGGSLNWAVFSNPTVNRLLDLARTQSTLAQRDKTYAKVVRILKQDDPYVFIYFPKNVIALSRRVTGFVNYPDGIFRLQDVGLR